MRAFLRDSMKQESLKIWWGRWETKKESRGFVRLDHLGLGSWFVDQRHKSWSLDHFSFNNGFQTSVNMLTKSLDDMTDLNVVCGWRNLECSFVIMTSWKNSNLQLNKPLKTVLIVSSFFVYFQLKSVSLS